MTKKPSRPSRRREPDADIPGEIPCTVDAQGRYIFHHPMEPEEVLSVAEAITSARMYREAYVPDPDAMRAYFIHRLANLNYEVFGVAFIDTQLKVLAYEELSRGTLASAEVHPREVVRTALEWNAAAVVLVHNHPSGSPEPSPADVSLTKILVKALGVVQVRVLDHIIVAGTATVSMAARGLV